MAIVPWHCFYVPPISTIYYSNRILVLMGIEDPESMIRGSGRIASVDVSIFHLSASGFLHSASSQDKMVFNFGKEYLEGVVY
jgi:hypothetical protein